MKKQSQLPVVELSIDNGQWLSEVEQMNPLPSNAIIHKTLPGIGATHGEILSERCSIIVLPNVPVITSKVAKHNKENPTDKHIIGVYKGITKDDIEAYMESDIPHKKILTTPEGFKYKVKPLLAPEWGYIKKNYYLLIDECERGIQDISYRGDIIAPFDDLFEFEAAGLISATTLPFSDPRFYEKDFLQYIVIPQFKYQQPLNLRGTNNVLAALREYLAGSLNNHYCFFLNSIETIRAIIAALDIKEETNVFCGEDSVVKLRLKGIGSSYSEFDTDKLAKYNFFTSRFFSAIDIKLPFKPDVVLITDVFFAEYSILDPQTEVIQIAGRFRNGINKLTHITNFNLKISYMEPTEVRVYLDGCQMAYKQLLKYLDTLESSGAKDFIREALDKVAFSRYFKSDGEYNCFMLDNHIQEEIVKSYYLNKGNLVGAYKKVDLHFKLQEDHKDYPLGDNERLMRESAQSRKALNKEVANQLHGLRMNLDAFHFADVKKEKDNLRKVCPLVVEAFDKLGMKRLEDTGFSDARIHQAIKKYDRFNDLITPSVVKEIYSKLGDKSFLFDTEILSLLQSVYPNHKISTTPKPNMIGLYYEAGRTTRGKEKLKGYNLFRKRVWD